VTPSFSGRCYTYLVSAWARAEVLVGYVELLDAEGAALLLFVVDELVLLYARHAVRVCADRARWGGVSMGAGVSLGGRGRDGVEMQIIAEHERGR
jgi:hypothetical protein